MADSKLAVAEADYDAAFANGAITLWSNLLTLIGTHLRENGTPRDEVLEMLTIAARDE